MISDLTPEQRSEVVYALLKASVPPSAIAKAFGMDPEHIAGALSQMRVERYGTDEKAEAMDFLIWEAYEEAVYQVRHGTPANKLKFCAMVLSRSVGIAGKSTPETAEKVRTWLDEMKAGLTPDVQLSQSIYESPT